MDEDDLVQLVLNIDNNIVVCVTLIVGPGNLLLMAMTYNKNNADKT